MDLAYPLSVVNGDIETIENATASQIRSYASIYQGESVLEPAFGRVTHPMSSSNRSPGLLAELERLNAKKYFADIQNIQFRGRFQDKKFILEITF